MKVQKKLFAIVMTLLSIGTLTSCDPQKRINKNFNYFQRGLDSIQNVEYKEMKFRENDLIIIQVIAGSLRQEDAALFNLSLGATAGNVNNTSGISLPNQLSCDS